MSFAWSNGTKQGIGQILANINAQNQQGGGSGVLAGLTGANQLAGGVQLNPDGTVASIAPVTVPHNILDAIFNHGRSQAAASAQNQAMQLAALKTTQGMTAQQQQNNAASSLSAQIAKQAQAMAIKQATIEHAKELGIAAYRDDGSLTDAGVEAQKTVDPARVAVLNQQAANQLTVSKDPAVIASLKGNAIAQNQSQGVANAANSFHVVPQGGTGVAMDPLNPTTPADVVTGGTPHSSSSTVPVIKNMNYGGISLPTHMGDESQSSAGVDAGGVQSFMVPKEIQAVIHNPQYDSSSTNNTVGDTSDPGQSAAEAEQQAQENAAQSQDTTTQTATPNSPSASSAFKGIGQLAQGIAALTEKQPAKTVDLSTANNLINQGAQQAQPTTNNTQSTITGGLDTSSNPFNAYGSTAYNGAAQQLNPTDATPNTNSSPTLQQILQLLKSAGSGTMTGINAITGLDRY